jgi:hypothetical protein
MPLIVVRHRPRTSLLQRQPRLSSVQRLDLRLRIYREDHGSFRRCKVQPNHVVQLLDELRILRDLESVNQVRLQSMRPPDATD